MFLKSKIGRYAGEVREYSPEAARALLNSGRAINPHAPHSEERRLPASGQPKIERTAKRRGGHGRN